MPQIQPNQVAAPGQQGAPKLYGVDKPQNNLPFQAKLMELFKPHEYVTIRNIYQDPIYWQYMPEEGEQIDFSEDGLQTHITREQPQMWMIEAGATEVMVGASAYHALDAMYKAVMAAMTLKRFRDPNSPQFDEKGQHLPKNFNYADSGAQDDFIKQAYVGKAIPAFQSPVAAPGAPVAAVPNGPSAPMPNQGGQVSGTGIVATSETAPGVQPMAPAPQGAPLTPPTYATPDAEEPAAPDPMGAAKTLVKANEPASKKK